MQITLRLLDFPHPNRNCNIVVLLKCKCLILLIKNIQTECFKNYMLCTTNVFSYCIREPGCLYTQVYFQI